MDFLQKDMKQYVENELGSGLWVPVYRSEHDDKHDTGFFCALIPDEIVEQCLSHYEWDLLIGNGMPGCIFGRDDDGTWEGQYYRFGNDSGIEPLVLYRSFGSKEPYVEVAEEFRLFHNLYEDRAAGVFIVIDEDGNEDEAIRFSQSRTDIKTKYLKEFLITRKMHLALYFEETRYSSDALSEDEAEKLHEDVKRDHLTYTFYAGDFPLGKRKSFSRLTGKKAISGSGMSRTEMHPGRHGRREYEEFVIGVDSDGDAVLHTCDPGLLANYFGANPGAPHFLTPVFFKPEVLQKYYSQPEKYQITDGSLYCRGFWSIPIDNNHPRYVIVFLGYLGQRLSHNEQLHWKTYNVEPDGHISDTEFRRAFLGEFADPEKEDLRFKSLYTQVNKKWLEYYGWPLYLTLSEEDAHNLTSLHTPLTNEQSEFDQQVLALAKVIVDSLNEADIGKHLAARTKEEKGLHKLERFLSAEGLADSAKHVRFLRDLYFLRSTGSGHKKGQNYHKAAAAFGLQDGQLSPGFARILTQSIDYLEAIDFYLEDKTTANVTP